MSFFVLPWQTAKEITGNKQLERAAPTSVPAQKSALKETVTPKMTRDTTVVGPGHLTVST